MDLIGDGKCNTGTYNTRECSYDGGDCLELNRKKENKYQKCTVSNIGWIGDKVCNGVDYMTSECGDDEGDCDACIEKYPMLEVSKLGDGLCDLGKYNTEVCGFDAGDCMQDNSNLQKDYPGCVVQNPLLIGDGACLLGEYNTERCGFDGGDCIDFNIKYPDCIVERPSWIGDGACNGENIIHQSVNLMEEIVLEWQIAMQKIWNILVMDSAMVDYISQKNVISMMGIVMIVLLQI